MIMLFRWIKRMINELEYGAINYNVEDKDSYYEFVDCEEAEKWGEEIYGDFSKRYKQVMNQSKNHLKGSLTSIPIECYCGYTYRQINSYLRGEHQDSDGTYRELSNLISIVICAAPRIPRDIIVYSMVCKKVFYDILKTNKEKSYPYLEAGFLSTSLLKDIAYDEEHNDGFLLKIYVNKGAKAIYVNKIANRSEEEVLFCGGVYLAMIDYPHVDMTTKKMMLECKLISFD